MKITDFLTPERVVPALRGKEKDEVLKEMAEGLAACNPELDEAEVLEVLSEREKVSTTAIGEGVAIPHGKLAGVHHIEGLFARSPEGVDFTSLDGGPTYLFFVLVVPEDAAADHLKALARISRLFKDPAFRGRLMVGKTRQDIFNIIASEDQKL